jgi:hypothetical protein
VRINKQVQVLRLAALAQDDSYLVALAQDDKRAYLRAETKGRRRMKECLDAIRTLQTGVLLLSATLLALSLTPNLAPRYMAATTALRAFPALPRDAATVAARARNQQEYERLVGAIDSIAQHPAPGVTMKMSPSGLQFRSPFNNDPTFGFQSNPLTESLAAEQRFYRGVSGRIRLLPDTAAFATFIRRRLPAWRPIIGELRLNSVSTSDFELTLEIRDSIDGAKNVNIPLQTADSAENGDPILVSRAEPFDPRVPRHESDFSTSLRLNGELISTIFSDRNPPSFAGSTNFMVLNGAEIEKIRLFAFVEDTLYARDRNGDLWSEIRDMSRAEAIRYTEERGRASATSLSLFGLSVNEQLASIGGPLVLWLALGYLLLHLQHLGRIAGTDTELLQRYPWPPLFPGVAGATASAVLLVIIPLAALVRFSLRVQSTIASSPGDEQRYALIQLLAGAAVLTGLAAHVAARRIRVAPIVDAQQDVVKFDLAPNAVGRRWSQVVDDFLVAFRARWSIRSLDSRTLTLDEVAPLRTEVLYTIGAWVVGCVAAIAGNVAVFVLFVPPGLRNWVTPMGTLASNTAFEICLAAVLSVGGIFAVAGTSAMVYRWFGSRVPFRRQAATLFQVMSLEPLVWCIAGALAAASLHSYSYVVALAIVSRGWYVVVGWARMRALHPLERNRISGFVAGFLIPFVLAQAVFVALFYVTFFLAANFAAT